MSVAIRYLEAWLRGLGAVAIDNLMEDAATAEISRSQVWQWIHQDRTTEDGTPITRDYVEGLIAEVLGEVERRDRRSRGDRFDDAADVFRDVALRDEFPAFLTLGGVLALPRRDRVVTDRMPRTRRLEVRHPRHRGQLSGGRSRRPRRDDVSGIARCRSGLGAQRALAADPAREREREQPRCRPRSSARPTVAAPRRSRA